MTRFPTWSVPKAVFKSPDVPVQAAAFCPEDNNYRRDTILFHGAEKCGSHESAGYYHTVTFCGNDDCCSLALFIPCRVKVPAGKGLILPHLPPKRCGYCFLVWNTEWHGDGTSFLPGETIPYLTEDLTLYAIWNPNPCSCPCPSPATGSFTLLKRDASTNDAVNDAVFSLSLNGTVVRNNLSDSFGRLFFKNLKPGTYQLAEVSAPDGYQPDPTVHTVTVDLTGRSAIDGMPADGYCLYNIPSGASRLV